jgi:30S ribosomal protein S31
MLRHGRFKVQSSVSLKISKNIYCDRTLRLSNRQQKTFNFSEVKIMGKGDKRTRRGKIFAGSFGKSRPKGKKKTDAATKENAQKTEE